MTNRSDAANKAWQTRRANARKADFSARGKKAWATRRANSEAPVAEVADPVKEIAQALQSDRSAAAHKAWATRRARRAAQQAIPVAQNAAHKAWETRRANGWVHPSKR